MSLVARSGSTKIGMEGSTAMPSALQIREQISAFLASEQSLKSLVEWLTRNIWNSDTEEAENDPIGWRCSVDCGGIFRTAHQP
jgi:cell fate (sporulation/competence/biofilm development) regulator YlbF (YheA/YmcA/DUF963 family)